MRAFQAAHTGLPSLVTDPIPAGDAYEITGSADGQVWTVAAGVGMGTSVAVSDPAAPLDVATVYALAAPGRAASVEYTRTIEAPYGVDLLITDEHGRHRVPILWEGDAASVIDPRAAYAHPLAHRWPQQTRQLVPAAPTWALECEPEAPDVPAARAAFASGLLWLVHSHARCTGPCTLPRAMRCGVIGTVAETSWTEGRSYKARLQQLETGVTGTPVVTWGEARRAGIVWGPGTSFAGIRAQIAGG